MRLALRAVLVCASIAASAHAQDDAAVARAREAYDRGAAAYDARDWGKAAAELARADELAPNATVLELAFSAATRANDAPAIMELADRIEKRVPESSKLFTQAHAARGKVAREVGQIAIVCPPPALFCKATLDGQLVAIGVRRWVKPGEHAVELTADGVPEKQTARVDAGGIIEVKPTPPAPPPPPAPYPAPKPEAQPAPASAVAPVAPPPPPHAAGISPAWFWVGVGLTVVVGGVTAWSALDTQSKHDAFAQNPTPTTQQDGRDSQLRTNILGLATVGAALTTTALGVFAVSWSHGPSATVGSRF